MHRLPTATSMASAEVTVSGGISTWVEDTALLGVKVTAHVSIDLVEHQRRETVGLAAVTDPALLDRLLDLPLAISVSEPVIWAEMADQPPGIIKRDDHCANVTRVLRSPLAIEDVIINAATDRELSAVQDASLFAGFTRRWVAIAHSLLPDAMQLEAKLCGVGILGPDRQVLLPAETPTAVIVDEWSWLLQEKVYRRWLSQRPQTHETVSQPPATGGASATLGG